MRPALIALVFACISLLTAAEEIAYRPGAVGKEGGSTSQGTRTIVEIPKAGKVLEVALTGKEWSGTMLVWTDFNPALPGNDPKRWKHVVITMRRLGGMDDGLLIVAPILKDAKCDKFLKVETYDPKSNTQRGFAEVAIPLADFGDLGGNVIGLHFGAMTKDRDKTVKVQIAKIAFR